MELALKQLEAALTQNLPNSASPPTARRLCPSCGHPSEIGERVCPACGQKHQTETLLLHVSEHANSGAGLLSDTPTAISDGTENPSIKRVPPDGLPASTKQSLETKHQAGSASGQPDAKAANTTGSKVVHLRCSNCAAEITADESARSLTCPFCDSNYVRDFCPSISQRQEPEFVIGFAVTPDQAQAKFRSWLRDGSWFRPGDLVVNSKIDKMRGVYLPLWCFSMKAESSWTARIGEYWYRTETYTVRVNGKTETRTRTVRETEWNWLSGAHHYYHTGYLVSGSKGLPQSEADSIMPFHLGSMQRYRPEFLAGWLSEEYSISRDAAHELAKQEFLRREQMRVAQFLPGDTHTGLSVNTQFALLETDLVLLPIYLLSYQYKGRLYRFLLNGQTGVVSGERPISAMRVVLAVLVLAALLALAALAFYWTGRASR